MNPRGKPALALPWRLRLLRDGLGTLIRSLGMEHAQAAGRGLARLVFDLNPPIRQTVETNLAAAYGQGLSEQALRQTAMAMFEHVASFWIEAAFAPNRLVPRNWERWISVPHQPAWASVARSGRPALLVTGYFGNPAVAACALSRLVPPLHVLVDPLSRLLVNIGFGVARRFDGLRFISAEDASWRAPLMLKAGDRVMMFAGTSRTGTSGVEATFLGRTQHYSAAIARLAHRCRADIVVFTCRRIPCEHFRFELSLLERIEPSARSAAAVTQQYLSILENAVRTDPEQYLWTRT